MTGTGRESCDAGVPSAGTPPSSLPRRVSVPRRLAPPIEEMAIGVETVRSHSSLVAGCQGQSRSPYNVVGARYVIDPTAEEKVGDVVAKASLVPLGKRRE